VRVEYGWGAGDANRFRRYAAELVALAPDVAPASGTLSVLAFQQANYPGPIVFTLVSDPVGAGFVDSLARPGGNITGFNESRQRRVNRAETITMEPSGTSYG
jgi:putative tryptophan/tyrosine transport system substrate-binding protein